MLQQIFYITLIAFSVVGILVLVTLLIILIQLYRKINEMLTLAKERATQVSDLIEEVSDRGQGLLHLFSKEGQRAVSVSSLTAILMNGYFVLRTILGNKHRKA